MSNSMLNHPTNRSLHKSRLYSSNLYRQKGKSRRTQFPPGVRSRPGTTSTTTEKQRETRAKQTAHTCVMVKYKLLRREEGWKRLPFQSISTAPSRDGLGTLNKEQWGPPASPSIAHWRNRVFKKSVIPRIPHVSRWPRIPLLGHNNN